MKQSITLSQQVIGSIKEHGEASFPNECCGFLFGSEDENKRSITLYRPADNSKEGDQRRRFEISPLEYMKAEQFADEKGLQFLGIFHTHPDHPAIASKWDLEKAMPYFSYVIASVRSGIMAEIRSWRLYDGERKFYEEPVDTSNSKIIQTNISQTQNQ